MEQYTANYQERWITFPLSVNNTTVSITPRKKKNGTAYPELSRTLENISSGGQSRILQSFQFQRSKRMKQRSWSHHERWRKFPLSVNNTTVSITPRKKKNGTAYLELSKRWRTFPPSVKNTTIFSTSKSKEMEHRS